MSDYKLEGIDRMLADIKNQQSLVARPISCTVTQNLEIERVAKKKGVEWSFEAQIKFVNKTLSRYKTLILLSEHFMNALWNKTGQDWEEKLNV